MNKMNIAVLAGDGIGAEIVEQALKVLDVLNRQYALGATWEKALIGGAAYDDCGEPLPASTLQLAKASDAVLLGAVGGYKWESLAKAKRPEAGLLGLRSKLSLYANLRPVKARKQLLSASTLKAEVIKNVDILLVRELISGIYFGEPRGIQEQDGKPWLGFNTMRYNVDEIEQVAKKAFIAAKLRYQKVCSVDKANVLECSELWRDTVINIHKQKYDDIDLQHMYVDNAAMQIILNPAQFDVILTGNLFGDILSDEASVITGSIGMLPSASLGDKLAMYEPIHGSAPDIAGKNIANPLATILSLAMMLQYSLDRQDLSDRIEQAVDDVLDAGLRTADLGGNTTCSAIGDAICTRLQEMSEE
ncbi:MAG: 3-isopropylmalate dehydrogenase [Mariprofundales bacterium]